LTCPSRHHLTCPTHHPLICPTRLQHMEAAWAIYNSRVETPTFHLHLSLHHRLMAGTVTLTQVIFRVVTMAVEVITARRQPPTLLLQNL
jgi:hypothetical protein